jgi:hypothetical protein
MVMAGVALDVQNPIGLGNFDERTCHYFLSFHLSWKDIAALVGVSHDSIRQWASRRNISRYTKLSDEWEQRIRAYIREKNKYDWGYRTISAEFHDSCLPTVQLTRTLATRDFVAKSSLVGIDCGETV